MKKSILAAVALLIASHAYALTANRVVKASSNTYITDSIIQDNGTGVGIGTAPVSGQKLAVDGTIKSLSGGFVFPDGSTQTVAFTGTGELTGSGTIGAIPKFTGSTALGDSIISESGSTITVDGQVVATTGTFSGQLSGKGTGTNDSAATGNIGEYKSAVATSVTLAATDVYADAVTLPLTAGDWLVVGQFGCPTQTITRIQWGISTTSGNSFPEESYGLNTVAVGTTTSGSISTRVSLAASGNVYLKMNLTYSGGTMYMNHGSLQAWRVR